MPLGAAPAAGSAREGRRRVPAGGRERAALREGRSGPARPGSARLCRAAPRRLGSRGRGACGAPCAVTARGPRCPPGPGALRVGPFLRSEAWEGDRRDSPVGRAAREQRVLSRQSEGPGAAGPWGLRGAAPAAGGVPWWRGERWPWGVGLGAWWVFPLGPVGLVASLRTGFSELGQDDRWERSAVGFVSPRCCLKV